MMKATTFNALLYAVPLFLAPFADKLADLWFQGIWPSGPQLVGCSLCGAIAMCIGLRAFCDGTYERSKLSGIPEKSVTTLTPVAPSPVADKPQN